MQKGFEQSSCERVRSYLDSYLKDELLVETNHEIQKHLRGCRNCAAELDARAHLKSILQRAVRAEDAPPALRAKIQTSIRANRPVSIFLPTMGRLGIAASLLLAALCLGAWGTFVSSKAEQVTDATISAALNPNLSEQTRQVLDVGLGNHVHCAINNGFQVEHFNFLSRGLSREYSGLISLVKETLGDGYKVVAAHHCLVNKREFTHLILHNQDNTLSLAITKKDGEDFSHNDGVELASVPLYNGRSKDYSVAGFETGEYLAYVASNLDSDDNARFASAIAPGVRRLLTSTQTARAASVVITQITN